MSKDYQQKLNDLVADIKYELADGVHTYHQCPHCNKQSTRSGKCAICLVQDFIKEISK